MGLAPKANSLVLFYPDLTWDKIRLEDAKNYTNKKCIMLIFLQENRKILVLKDRDIMGFKITDKGNLAFAQYDESLEVRSFDGTPSNEKIKTPDFLPSDFIVFNGIAIDNDKWKQARKMLGELWQ